MAKRKPKFNGYEELIKFNHNEIPAKVNIETGELIELNPRKNNIPNNRQVFLPNENFDKVYYASHYVWEELELLLSDLELRVARKLVSYGSMNNNSLKPLSNDVTLKNLALEFNIGKNRVKPIFNKLFNLGFYANIDVKDERYPDLNKFWVLNPYLTFSGKTIHIGIISIFEHTPIKRFFFDGIKKLDGGKPKMKYIKEKKSL